MNIQDTVRVEIEWKALSATSLRNELQREIPELERSSVSLKVPRSKRQPDALALDPTFVVGLITGGASVLAAAITALASMLAKKEPKSNVVVSLPDGTKLHFPATLSPAQIDAIVSTLERARSARITVCE